MRYRLNAPVSQNNIESTADVYRNEARTHHFVQIWALCGFDGYLWLDVISRAEHLGSVQFFKTFALGPNVMRPDEQIMFELGT